MAVSQSFIDYAKDLFGPFGEIVVRRMFGAAGVYCDSLFFAVLDEDVVYLKADDENRAEFERAGALPFTFESKENARVSMSYYAAPADFYDDPDEARRWTLLALDSARRAAKVKRKRRKPPGRSKRASP
ncbi:MAG: TfoX/Sxy family protein [Parvularculaceae bacterium]|nr:TfoX/Sxy family protein [Parvularculaceae bacterium]